MILETSKIKINYEKTGEGDPLILLHGNGETHEIFDKAIPLLKEHFTVYALDTRGHGQSSKVKELHYSDMADDVKDFIELLGIEKPVIYGFSDGAIAALDFGMKYPQAASKIIVSGVNISPDGIRDNWLNWFKFLHFFTRSKKLKLMISEPNWDFKDLHKIETPVELSSASRDIIKTAHTRKIVEHIPRCTHTIFLGENHGSYIVHSDKIAQFILDVCDKVKVG